MPNSSLTVSTVAYQARILGCLTGICYNFIGCFKQEYPWVSLKRPFPCPASPEKINTTLLFYSREEKKGQSIKIYPDIKFKISGFKANRRTVIITHGFQSNATTDWIMQIKDKYLQREDANIFLVDWSDGASGINYLQSAANTRVAGAVLGRFGKYLLEEGVEINRFHLIGHSLGAHMLSYAAKIINNSSSGGEKVYRITGLDAAQPGYENQPSLVRLSADDADFVEAIHSDAKPLIPYLGLGYIGAIGHVDFYLNKGYNQPNCIDHLFNISSINDLVDATGKVLSCSHGRSYEVFTSSIDESVKCKFVGHRLKTTSPIKSNQYSCGKRGSDCITMGLETPKQKPRGSFQVLTSGEEPFCCYKRKKDSCSPPPR